jgi:hypothetical protein
LCNLYVPTLRSRTAGKGLAAHLQVPLPYLLYRAQTRYEEDLRGLQDIRGVLSPPNAQGTPPKSGDDLVLPGEKPTLKISTRTASTGAPLSASTRQTTPLAVRARLNSLGNSSRSQKVTSSSTITLQGPRKPYAPLRRTSPSPSSSSNSEDEAAAKEEENERLVEEQDALAKKLSVLQKMMTSDALGLVSPSTSSTPRRREMERGRFRLASSMSIPMSRHRDDHHSSRSQSVSSTSSPQNSIPSVPSPSDSQRNSPISRHLSHSKSSSPPAVSPRSARGRSHLRYGPLISPAAAASEQGSEVGSTHGTSSASSFSDLSGEPFLAHLGTGF